MRAAALEIAEDMVDHRTEIDRLHTEAGAVEAGGVGEDMVEVEADMVVVAEEEERRFLYWFATSVKFKRSLILHYYLYD